MSRLAVLGAGSWGTALCIALASRFERIDLWARDPEQAGLIAASRQNHRYLPGLSLPSNVNVSSDIRLSLEDADFVLGVMPSANLRTVFQRVQPHVRPGALLVSATKGLELGSLARMSEVILAILGGQWTRSVAVLSGPTFAKEVAAGEPAAVVIASEHIATAEQVQKAFSTPSLRLYTTQDVIGVELGAALKNVIAIGAGICRGLGLGSNSVAALVTRGLAEITRLAVTMGGNPRTLSGLAGLGDLVLTATGDLSRNRFVGIQLGQGYTLQNVLGHMSMVAEGIGTCAAARELGRQSNVALPIINKMHEILYENKDPRLAIRELMDRPLTTE